MHRTWSLSLYSACTACGIQGWLVRQQLIWYTDKRVMIDDRG
jgi:hypothetical protein